MDDQLQQTLLELFRQVCREPETVPEISLDAWAEDSQERLLLVGLREMLGCVQENASRQRYREEQLREHTRLEERQRLARELHDSVSQALYGIALGAHTARALLARNSDKTAEPLDYVLSQAEAALMEMRALIFELRPETLADEGLVAALARRAAVLRARHGLSVVEELGGEPDLALKIKQELYRIAQEALHNITRHARAQRVDLRLSVDAHGLLLQIQDDGVGFETTRTFPGHLGLRSIHERVARLRGQVHIQSAPGQGTTISVRLPDWSADEKR
jgi:signal transduction histidine kinase